MFIAAHADTARHPFLIVRESDYPELRDRANRLPWSEMRLEAIQQAQELTYDPEEDNGRGAGYKLRDMMGYTALAYILDSANKERYVDKIQETLNVALPDMLSERKERDNWDTTVPFQGGIFNAILALDIIYRELPAHERSTLETDIAQLVNGFRDNWGPANHSVSALWAFYERDTSKFEQELQQYDESWVVDITIDGVYTPGTGYAAERIGSCSREHKALGMDVWEYQGHHNYYTNEQFIKLHEWLYGYSHTPDFRTMAFGDSLPNFYLLGGSRHTPANCSTQPYRAYRFGEFTRRYATWQMQDGHRMPSGNAAMHPNGRLLTYILMADEVPDLSVKVVPPSRVFPDGGAWFLENQQSRKALAGAMWNPTHSSGHSHKETNAIFLSGYGAHLLSNSGYKGWRRGVGNFSWDYIHDRAVSGNTGLIDYQFDRTQEGNPPEENDHQYKHGAGIQEWLLTPTFDYARGDSGEALPNGQHFRNFHFVHPSDGKHGYWFLIDEFTGGNQVHLAFHPYARTLNQASPAEYQADIVNYEDTEITDVDLTVFLGTPPDDVTLHNGVIAGPDIENQYLYASYNRSSGKKQIVTVLVPSDHDHQKPELEQIRGEYYSGAKVDHGDGVIDYIVESDPNAVEPIDNAAFQASRSLFRLVGTDLRAVYAVGRSFEYDADLGRKGFQAEQDLALYLREGSGQVVSPTAQRLTLYYPTIRGAYINGSPAPIVQATDDSITINIPAGTSSLDLVVADES
ncbi:hypothetical protein C7B61_17280 [filamentous cyanobacterium CCP1]|nr:hypothetical protein C7B76_05415 [filamentous cyanobacterium CCP2]PSB60544.1 hypothetical protein C7B61_17280 [filamentous cyanobacterium CCP1]